MLDKVLTGLGLFIVEPAQAMWPVVILSVSYVIVALFILLVGLVLARLFSGFANSLLEKIKFNDFAAKIGLADILAKGGLGVTAINILSGLVYWSVMLIAFAVTVDALGLKVAADLLEKILGYIPNVVSAVFVALVGMFFANLIASIVKAAASNANVARGELLASIAKGGILFVVIMMTLDQLMIATFFVGTTFQIFFGAVCFALALAFGLGGKDLAAKVLWDFYNKQNMNR